MVYGIYFPAAITELRCVNCFGQKNMSGYDVRPFAHRQERDFNELYHWFDSAFSDFVLYHNSRVLQIGVAPSPRVPD